MNTTSHAAGDTCDLSVVIPAKDEAENLRQLLPDVYATLSELGIAHEILVIDAQSPDGTRQAVEDAGATYVAEAQPG